MSPLIAFLSADLWSVWRQVLAAEQAVKPEVIEAEIERERVAQVAARAKVEQENAGIMERWELHRAAWNAGIMDRDDPYCSGFQYRPGLPCAPTPNPPPATPLECPMARHAARYALETERQDTYNRIWKPILALMPDGLSGWPRRDVEDLIRAHLAAHGTTYEWLVDLSR